MEITPRQWPSSPLKRKNLQPQEIKDFLRIRADYEKSAFVTEGHFEVRALNAKEFTTPLPPEESAVTALLAHSSGHLYGATSGPKAHLFFYNPAPDADACADIGIVASETQIVALTEGTDHAVYGLANQEDKMFLFRYSPCGVILEQMDFTGLGVREVFDLPAEDQLFFSTIDPCHSAGKLEILDLQMPQEKGTDLVADSFGNLWFLTEGTGSIYHWNPAEDEAPTFCASIGSMGGHSPRLLATPAGVLAAGLYGKLFLGDAQGLHPIDCQAPCIKGRELYNRVTAWTKGPSPDEYYGGTIDGLLFQLQLSERQIRCLGKPTDQPVISSLACTAGQIYGLNGSSSDCAHLFRFAPEKHDLRDLGCILARSERPWNGYRCETLVTGKDGTLFLGENDRLGHLFRYFPPLVV